jgi:hypothetical protein
MEEAIKQWPNIDKNSFVRAVENKTVNIKYQNRNSFIVYINRNC